MHQFNFLLFSFFLFSTSKKKTKLSYFIFFYVRQILFPKTPEDA